MRSRDFAYWLQGYCELSVNTGLTSEQLQIVKNHLNMVFKHEIDPQNLAQVAHTSELSNRPPGLRC